MVTGKEHEETFLGEVFYMLIGVVEMYYILTGMTVRQVHTFVTLHGTVHLETHTIYKLNLNKVDFMSKKVFQSYSNGMFTDYIFSLDI